MTTLEALATRVDFLEAQAAIQKLIGLYAHGADRKNDPAILGPLFTADATWEAPGIAEIIRGRETIAEALANLGQTFVLWSLHYMVSPVIDVAEDRQSATCRWYLWELCTMTGDDGIARDTWFGGWYDAWARREADGWRFSRVELHAKLQSPNDVPWTGKR
jgi:SnoaL-like domain